MEKRKELEQEGVFYFDTYIGAARIAFAHNLISKDGLIRVLNAAKSDFKEIKFSSEKQRTDRLNDLNRDISVIISDFPSETQIEACS